VDRRLGAAVFWLLLVAISLFGNLGR
jgi:hypothetical protein